MKLTMFLDRTTPMAATRSPLTLALGAVLFAVLTGVGAALAFPLVFSPVPVTLQTLFVILSGAVLGPVAGPASQLLYVGAGLAGWPVFAGGMAGPGVLAGPTGGYLVGFVVASWVAGMLVRPQTSWWRIVPGLLIAHVVVFVFGLSHLMLFLGSSPKSGLELGVIPFLPGLAVKTVAAAGLLKSTPVSGWFRS